MRKFEYKAIPAPHQGTKARGVKSTGDRFALSMTELLNEMAAEGWEYVRAETLPCDERKGLTGTQTTYQNILIFRKLEASVAPLALDPAPIAAPAPEPQGEMMDDEYADAGDIAEPHEDPVAPRPIAWDDAEAHSAPPLGSARGD